MVLPTPQYSPIEFHPSFYRKHLQLNAYPLPVDKGESVLDQ